MRKATIAAIAGVGLGLVAGPDRVLAQGIQVTPIQVELTERARTAIVTLHNLGTEPVRVQVTAFAWDESPRGDMQLSRTKDVTFYPGLFTIGAGQKRNLRIATSAAVADVEKTYRVFVEQLPGGPDASRTTVRMRMRIGIPVYLEPRERSPAADLSPVHRDGRKISFVLRNTGNVRVRPASVKLAGKDEKDQVVFELPLSGWYVLAGGERIFEAEAPREGCARVRTLSAEVGLEKSTLRAQTPTPDGACGP